MKEHITAYRVEYLILIVIIILLSMLLISFNAYIESKVTVSCDDLHAINLKQMPERCK